MRATSLGNKITIVMISVAVVQAFLIFLAGQYFIMPHFEMLQRQEASRNIFRVGSAIDNHLVNLDRLAFDWSSWNDTYDFRTSRDQDYLKSNLIWESFEDNRLNLIAMYDNDGRLVWGGAFDLETRKRLEIRETPVRSGGILTDKR